MEPGQTIVPITGSAETSPAYWLLDILWCILVDGEQTGGRYSVMEQLMPEGAGPPPHIHAFNDEWFYKVLTLKMLKS